MNQIGMWFRQLGAKLGAGIRSFMTGRYGTDKLNMYILGVGVIVCLISLFIPVPAVNLICTLISYGRYQENRRFLLLLDRVKDRQHRYFDCPKCRQPVRVPRGKGKIAITCPKCKEKFIRKTGPKTPPGRAAF